MSHHEHERPVHPFSDLHVKGHDVHATLLHDPTVEGLDMAIYMDGSGSMSDEYEYEENTFWDWLFGRSKDPEDLTNVVEPQVRRMLAYLATKDRGGQLRMAYWATGEHGNQIEVLGEYGGKDIATAKFGGPKHSGGSTRLLPALEDFVAYMEQQAQHGAERGCGVFVTDGHIHDADAVKAEAHHVAEKIAAGQLPPMNFILVGVGHQVDEEQMEDICHAHYPGVEHLWCHRIAEEMEQLAELVAVLVDETMTVASGGVVYDDHGNILKRYEARLPAVLEFEVPEGCESFTLEVGGQRFTQPLPEGGHHEEDEHHEEERHHGGHH